MSKADVIFKEMCQDVIENGFSSEGYAVRPKWEDGTPAHTIKKFGVVNRYDLQKEFPILTLRKTFLKSAVDELLWIWQKKSNNIYDMKSHVWDEWADKKGSIGKAYGYQQSIFYPYKGITEEGLKKAFPDILKGHVPSFGPCANRIFSPAPFIAWGYQPVDTEACPVLQHPIAVVLENLTYMTQLDKAIYDIVNNPLSRRIIVSMWNPSDLYAMHLEPCAYSMTFNVTGNKLNAILNQRSQDILAANAWNVCQYSALLMMIARHCNLIPGELVHVIADAHIYDRHVPIIQDLIQAKENKAPKVILNPEKHNFYDFVPGDFSMEDYHYSMDIKNIPIAV